MSEIKLKPCPFCGGEAFIHELCEDFLGVGWKIRGFAVSCQKCHATTQDDKDRNIAIQSWDKRAGQEGEKKGQRKKQCEY